RRNCQRDLSVRVTAGMPCYTYAAVDAVTGREQRGRIEGVDIAAAVADLKARGLHPGSMKPVGETSMVQREHGQRAGPRGRAQRAMSSRERMLFTRQLASLLNAGLPLVRGLEVLARQRMGWRTNAVATSLAE